MNRAPVHILLVEDDQVDRLACRRALVNHPDYDFKLIEAETARQGLQLALRQTPDLILLDYHLPDMSGLEFLAELGREAGEPPVPVMMLTGTDNVGVAVEAMRGGAHDYLVKDSERQYLELLPAVIERVLREQRLRTEKRAAEAKFRTLVEQIPAITYIAALDVPGRLLYISPQVRRLGYSPEEWLEDTEGLLKLIHPEDRSTVHEAYAASYEQGIPLRCEYRIVTREGQTRWMLDEARIVQDGNGKSLFLQGVLIDITEKKRTEEELRYHHQRLEELVARRTGDLEKQTELLRSANANLVDEIGERREVELALRASEARFRLLLESAGDGILGVDMDGNCTFVNGAALELFGYAEEELIGRPLRICGEPGSPAAEACEGSQCPIDAAVRSGVIRRGMIEPLVRKDGTTFTTDVSSYPLREGECISGAVLVFRDVTEHHEMAKKLTWQATHDALTGLVNRQEFERRLGQSLRGVNAGGGEHALCYMDLDWFKVVNDTCGHAAGDELLRRLSRLLQGHMRQRDTLGRLGGDEFGVLLEHCPSEQAVRIALELRDAVSDYQFLWKGQSFSVGASIGVVPLTAAMESADAALNAADAACYLAKERGRNRVELFDAEDTGLTRHHDEMRWMSRLTRALDEGRFRLYYQSVVPLVEAEHARHHYEILLRLEDPEEGLLEAATFVPVAERCNLMPTIDRWVLREVIATIAARGETAAEAPLFSVNLSAISFFDELLPGYLQDLLARHGVPGGMICLEVPESAAMANIRMAGEQIAQFKQLGCRVALDQFARGALAFSNLRSLPVDFVKLDGALIRSLTDDTVNRTVAEAIHLVAGAMSISTVAECTESDALIEQLKTLGIDFAQGYVLDRPRPIETLNGSSGHTGD
ncbi:EAL domain-containing protein [Thioalkalivibrio thiocyanodenitrificans]|uniref:EAL domain-containing protein n=1 Tax=Thioalkalivibrio thiocyanodenitrificans TaxID=243063 RepID=UPI0003755EC1|nr:EAL domain-containing protein [Thioalkalivibrio thiocyanodenitrificans]